MKVIKTPKARFRAILSSVGFFTALMFTALACCPALSSQTLGAPTNLQAVAGDTQVSLSWTAVSGATSYNVYMNSGTTPIATGITTTSYVVWSQTFSTGVGLSNGTNYTFNVAAVNSSGAGTLSSTVNATPTAQSVGTTPTTAVFNIYPQVLASSPVPVGFNMQPAAGTNITENTWLADGGFSPYDARFSLTATQNGTATTFVAENNGSDGGTDYWSSITTGYFVGATAYTYRYTSGAWSLLRTDTVTAYTADGEDETPANCTITFASSGPATETGDIIWLVLDNVQAVPSLQYLDARFTTYSPNWSTESQGSQTRTATWPYVLSTNVPSSDTGGLSLELTDTTAETNGIWQYMQGAFVGPADEEFQSGHTYEVSVWLMQSGIASGSVTFSINGLGVTHTFTGVTGSWQQFTWTFPAVAGLPANSVQPAVHLDFSAPGTLWVDNFQLYDAAWDPNTVSPTVLTAWENYHPGTIRIWSNFGTSNEGYGFFSLNSWLTPEIKTRNTQGIGNQYELPGQLEHLPDALANVKTVGANPWLLVNMSLSPTEWGELIDYLAAPAGTGYASQRPSNHTGPYTADFSTIYIELGDEEWGTQVVPADTAYGEWANFLISQAIAGKSYFNSSEIKFVLNGFTLNPSFGSAAITAAPQASLVDYFLYSSGSSTGNNSNTFAGDQYYQSDLVQVPVTNGPWINAIVSQQQLDASNGHNYAVASYEEGPGTDTYGGNNVGDDTLAGAIGSIDTTLYASQNGFGPQNIFEYQLGTGPFTTHTNFANGFIPHPVWEANQMRNNYCTGPMVLTSANANNPTYSDPNITAGAAIPLIAVYTFADANVANQADVVVISRSLDNQTPVTLNFPAAPTGTAELYTLTGDPRQTNNNALNIPIANRQVTVTQSYTFTMPPGSMYLFQVPMNGTWSSSGEPAPPVPATLTAAAGNGKVTLTWAGSTGATGYNVLRGTVNNGPYSQIGTSTSVAYTDSAVTNGTTYYYVVQATNGGGASGNSPQASATPNVLDDAETGTQPPLTGANTGAWANANFVPMTHEVSGSTPDTAQYKTLWDANYLYVLASVQDSTLTAPTQANIWTGDTVEVYFSGTDNQGTTYGPTDFQYAFPYGSGGAVVTESKHNATTGVIFGQENITGGYQMAMAIPWTTLGTTPVAGTQYGFEMMIDDASSQGVQAGKLAWWGTTNNTWDNPSLMGPLVLTSGGTQQTITFTAPTTPVTYGVSPITLSATASSGLAVTFSVSSGPGTVSGDTLTVTGAGTIVVAANQGGNGTYAPAPQVTHTIVVNQASQTINFTAPTSPVTYPVSPITLSATASSGLAVTFSVVSGPGTVSGSTLTVTGTGTIVVAANQAGNANYTAAAQVTQSVVVNSGSGGGGTLLAYEPFGEASGTALNGVSGSGDSGWGTYWYEQSGSTAIPGYEILSTTPLTYSGLQTTGNYAIGGYEYQSAGRQLNVASGGPFNSYLSGGLIGASGQTIWLSFLLREDVSNGDINAVFLNNYSGGNAWVPGSSDSIGIGYFGGTADWGLQYSGGTPVLSSAAVVQGHPTLLVAEITFGSTNVINLYVNPTSLGGSAPSSPSATISTTGSVAFESLAYEGGYATNDSSLADIRFGTTYAAVTPTSLASQTITFTAPTSPVTYGVSPITLSASASSGLAVTFSVVSGPGTVSGNTLTVTGAGTIVVAANQAGNSTYAPAPQVTQNVVVNQESQTITFTAPTTPVTYGVSPISLSATASSGLAVTFSVSSGPGTISGSTLTVTGVGTIVVAANQAGNTNYSAATQVTHNVVVNQASQAISFTQPTTPVVYGVSPISLSATASSGLAVTFSVSSGPGTISGSTLTVTGVGTIVVAANQAGNADYTAATQVTKSVVVTQATQTINFTAPTSPVTYPVSPITLQATASSGLAVTFSVSSGPGTVSGSTLTVTGTGTIVVAANQAGNADYAAATQVTQSIVVNAGSSGTLLAYEPFGEASGTALNGVSGSGDSGWGGAWVEQSGSTAIPGYEILSTTPLTYSGLQTTGNYAIGGYEYQSAGRLLNVASGGPFNSYLSNGLIGASGQTIWLSFLLREDVSNGDTNAVFLNNYGSGNSWVPGSSDSIGIGYFGGTADWGLQYSGGTPVLSSVAVVQGHATLLVVEITFGSTNVINLYVNPTSLGGSAPSSPSATISTTGSVAFQSFAYEGGYTTSDSSLADIRFGTTYASVTP
ncbi:MAG: sugar-binding protein [Terracidiphilus sp.]|jgi:hypothetical protein